MKSRITMDFARRDDCLDQMVPSDLRLLIGERDTALEQLEELQVVLQNVKNALLPCPEKGELSMARKMVDETLNGDEAYEYSERLQKAAAENARLRYAGKRLSFAAQTTGGTAGRDEELVEAISQMESALAASPEGGMTDEEKDAIENGQFPEPIEYAPQQPESAVVKANKLAKQQCQPMRKAVDNLKSSQHPEDVLEGRRHE